MKLLTLEQLLAIHTIVVSETGGAGGLRDLGRLESAIAAQSQHVFEEELFVGVVQKSAALIRGLIADHPFVDGNKRTAMLAGLTLLQINNVKFQFKLAEIEDFAVKIAVQKLDVKDIAHWLDSHVAKA